MNLKLMHLLKKNTSNFQTKLFSSKDHSDSLFLILKLLYFELSPIFKKLFTLFFKLYDIIFLKNSLIYNIYPMNS